MQYTKKDLGSFKLHMIKTDKFKTMTIKIVFHSPIVKEEITLRNVLSDILLQSTKNYSTKRSMVIEAEELYAADIYNNSRRWGNYILTSFIMQVLNDKYTEEGNFEKALEFLSEIIFNPDIDKSSFKEDNVNLVKNNCEVALSSIKEDSHSYSLIRLKEAYDKESPVSYRMAGYKEDIESIDGKKLYDYYIKMIDTDFVDVFVVGNFDENEILQLIKKYIKFRKLKKDKIPYEIEPKHARPKRLIAKEKINNNQSQLNIACTISSMKPYEKNYPLVLANIIYGGGCDSKLFKIVREQNSLCYSIYSAVSKLDNLLIISSGIDKENYSKTLEVSTEILQSLKKGEFSENDIKIAKELYNVSTISVEESPMSIINEYLIEEIIGLENYKERIEIMNNVTKNDIIKALKKIKMDTVFLLEGEKE